MESERGRQVLHLKIMGTPFHLQSEQRYFKLSAQQPAYHKESQSIIIEVYCSSKQVLRLNADSRKV
jgi:hypothetical protein